MSDISIAMSLHLLGVVWRIGRLAFVTAVLVPESRREPARAGAVSGH